MNYSTCFICLTDLELLETGKTESLKDAPQIGKSCDKTISKQTKIVNVFCEHFNLNIKNELEKRIYTRRSNFAFCDTCKMEIDQILNLQSLLEYFWGIIKQKIQKNKLKNIRLFADGKENASDVFREQIFKKLAVKPNDSSKRTKPHFKRKGAVKTTNRPHFINKEITKNPYVDLGEKLKLFCEESMPDTEEDTIHDDEIETLSNKSYHIKDEIQNDTISSPNSPDIPFDIHNESDSPYSDFESGQEAGVATENQTSHSNSKKRNNRNGNLKNRKPQRNTARIKTESLEKVTKTSEGKVFFKNQEIILCDDEKSIQCSLCDYKVNNNRYYNMKIHILSKHLKAFYCADCDKTFNTQHSLYVHMTAIHRWRTGYPEKYECKICSKPFKYPSNAQTHEITHLGKEERMAKERRKKTKSAGKDQKNRKEMRFICAECGKSFQFDCLLQYHMETHVDINERGRHHLCSLCGKTFVSKRHLRQHIKFVHNKDTVKGWVCEVCGLKCNNPSSLSIHVRSHTKEKPYLCHYCNKLFSTMGGLKAHTPMHTGERNYKCKQCDKSYTCSKHLLRHVQSVHLKMKIKKYRKPKNPIIVDDSSTTAVVNLDSVENENSVNQSIPLVMNSHTDLMTFRLIEVKPE